MPALLTAILVCIAAIFVVFIFARRVEAGLICLLTAQLYNAALGLNATLVGRLHLNALDAVSVGLLIAGAIRFVRSLRVLTVPRILIACYALLFIWSFVRGCEANGPFAAANEARGFVGPLAAMLYFADALVDHESMRRYVRCYLLFGACLCLVAVLAVAGLPVGVAAWSHAAAETADHRVLPSSAAAIIAICGFFALARATYAPHRLPSLLWPTLFFLTAIYLRHRTVWIMLLAGVVALMFFDGKLFHRIVPIVLTASVAVLALVVLESDQLGVASQSEFAQSLSNTDTWQWRVNGWQEFLFDSDQSTLTALAGKPMGSGWWRIDPESHLLQTAPPHNEYVTEYLRVGALGLLLVFLFACRPLVALSRIHAIDGAAIYPCATIWSVIALMTLVFGTTYSIEPELFALLGIANAMANHARAPEAAFAYTCAHRESEPSFAS